MQVAHIYEYTTQSELIRVNLQTLTHETPSVSISPSLKIKGAEQGAVPMQVIFCLKEKNQKKINSHRSVILTLTLACVRG